MTENRIGKAPAGTYSLLDRIYQRYAGEVDRRGVLNRQVEGVAVSLGRGTVYMYPNGRLLQGLGMHLLIDKTDGWSSRVVIAEQNKIADYFATSPEKNSSVPPPTIEEMLDIVRRTFPLKQRK